MISKLARVFTAFREDKKELKLVPFTTIIKEIMLNFCAKLHGSH